jgi:hypothetical protein
LWWIRDSDSVIQIVDGEGDADDESESDGGDDRDGDSGGISDVNHVRADDEGDPDDGDRKGRDGGMDGVAKAGDNDEIIGLCEYNTICGTCESIL